MSSIPLFFALVCLLINAPDSGAFMPKLLLEVVTVSVGSLTHSQMSENAILISTAKFFNSYPFPQSQTLPEDTVTSAEDMFQAYYGKRVSTTDYETAVDDICTGNSNTDMSLETRADPTYHFDAETFYLANAGLKSRFNATVASINSGNWEQARTLAGQYLHPLEDFYSHSNWVEMGRSDTNDALGIDGAFIGLVADVDTPTCSNCKPTILSPFTCNNNILSSLNDQGLLTSGYYGGESIGTSGVIIQKPPNKCSHGGVRDSSRTQSPEGGIDKDATNSMFAPHHYLHDTASGIAQTASVKFLDRLRAAVGDELFAGFLNLKWPTGGTAVVSRRRRSSTGSTKTDKTVLLSVRDMPAAKKTLKFNVDSLLDSFTIHVSHDSQAPNFTITHPQGKLYPAAVVEDTSKSRQSRVVKPAPGTWSITVEGTVADWFAEIRATATFDALSHFEIPHTDAHAHTGPEVVHNNPILGDQLILKVRSTCRKCPVKTANFLDIHGAVLKSFSLKAAKAQPTVYTATVTVPHQAFNIEVAGTDAKGNAFQRLHHTLITPTQIRLNFTSGDSSHAQWKQGYERTLDLIVKNVGPAGTFDLSAQDSDHIGLVTDFQPKSMNLAQNEAKPASVRITVPKTAPVGHTIKAVFAAKLDGSDDTNFNFFKKSITVLEDKKEFPAPTCKILASKYNSTCTEAVPVKQCLSHTWTAQVEFEEFGSGIDGVFVTGSGDGNVTWSKSDGDASKPLITTVNAAGTCCLRAVNFLMIDKAGLTGRCVLKQKDGKGGAVNKPHSVFSAAKKHVLNKLKF